jgi:hypothetical protein
LALLAALASSAGAAPRYASPNGSGSTCAEGSPCKITVAVAGAHSGDTVILAGNEGSYGTTGVPLTTQLTLENGVSMQGAPGQPMPQLYSEFPVSSVNWAVRMEGGSGVKLSDVAIHVKNGVAAVHVNSTMERVLAVGEAATGCDAGPATTIVDSVCAGRDGIFNSVGSVGSHYGLTLRNDTIYGAEVGLAMLAAASGAQAQVSAVNTIVRGVTKDVEAVQSGGATTTVDLDHSNYTSVKAEGGATVTAPGSGANQTAAPLLTNAAGGFFTQTVNSPTIDAGANDGADGSLDLAGNGRTLAGRTPCSVLTDIGAYEYAPGLPPCPQPASSSSSSPASTPPKAKASPAPTTTILKAKVKELTARFRFKGVDPSGAGVKFECKLDRMKYHRCHSPKAYKNLKPGKHKFLVRAVSASGVDATPAKRKFRIQAGD